MSTRRYPLVGPRGVRAVLVAALLGACTDAGPELAIEIVVPASTDVVVGETVTLTFTTTGDVGTVLWTSRDPSVGTVGLDGVFEAIRPGTVTVTASAPDAVAGELTLAVLARPNGYTADEIDYFSDIAFGAEFGSSTPFLRRWTPPGPTIRINGSPTTQDLDVLDAVLGEINDLTGLDIQIVTDDPIVEMHFVPVASFQSVLPEAPPGNIGLVWLWWNGADQLVQSVVLVASDRDLDRRTHIIREEVTQMLGLLQDSFDYPESIFFQGFSLVDEYLPIDRAVIEILYRPELTVGMSRVDAARVARRLTRYGTLAGVPGPVAVPRTPIDRFGGAIEPGSAVASGGSSSGGGSR